MVFVLVHGAWHGGWCWRDAAARIRAVGHDVTAPTLTGLGERAHLLHRDVGFETMVEDVLRHIEFERLDGIVLVGHSFGAAVCAAVADRIPERLASVIFLDGFLPQNGCSMMDLRPAEEAGRRLRAAQDSSDGLTMPCPRPAAFGLERAADAAEVESRLTPHPLRSYLDEITLSGPVGNGLRCAFVRCTRPRYPGLEASQALAVGSGWTVVELETGHDAMIAAPADTAATLLRLGAAGS